MHKHVKHSLQFIVILATTILYFEDTIYTRNSQRKLAYLFDIRVFMILNLSFEEILPIAHAAQKSDQCKQ